MDGPLSSWLEPTAGSDLVAEVIAEATERLGASSTYEAYQGDPVAFAEEVFGESLTEDVQRVFESVRDNVVTIALSANATGKTHGAARLASWLRKAFPSSQVYTAAAPPKKNLETLLWGELGGLVRDHPEVFEGDEVTALNIESSPKEFITGVTIPASGTDAEREARFSGKHAPVLAFIIDEGDGVPGAVYRGIESCMSGGWVRLLVMLNPRAPKGPVYDMIQKGQANVVTLTAFAHPNVITGEDVIPGAVTRDTTVRRINEWTRPLGPGELVDPDDPELFEVPDFLVGETATRKDGGHYPPLASGWRRVTESAFMYMVLARFPAQGANQLISTEHIHRARARWDAYVAARGETPPEGVRPRLGLDVAEEGDDANVLCPRYGGYVGRLTKWKGMSPDDTAERLAECHHALGAERSDADGTGVGAGVARRAKKDLRQLGVSAPVVQSVKVAKKPTRPARTADGTVLGEFAQLRDQLYWEVREWLAADGPEGAMLPPDDELVEELRTLTYEVRLRDGRIVVMSKKLGRQILGRSWDSLDGLALTFAPEAPSALGGLTSFRG